MSLLASLLAVAIATLQSAMAQEVSTMGPAAFLWPPDRAYSAAWDNTAPCGSSAGVSNRTQFPLSNAAVAVVLQDESYSVNLAVSYNNDPTSNSDFTTLVSGKDFPEIEPGHECYSVPNPPSSVTAGSNATLQLSYTSTFDGNTNETYYACADIQYVALSDFKTSIPCFNVTEDTSYTTSAAGVAPTTTSTGTASEASSTSTGSAVSPSLSSSHHHSGLSGGAIAGIVVGTIAGAVILGAILFVAYRAHIRRVKRDVAVNLRMKDMLGAHKTDTHVSGSSGDQR
ncbi:hypothetical protein A1O1_04082 [Capronia coronata CBS 617.96]|uniref:Copper acquisition factor BIM1-like domain-containing protein n=1 Tax=Capronia coronata CBS 617.96 TaxID=1182541 RepID=W9YMS9_9EURO|nr:uncharacterized protein A1O1_04082 [Capronia coronata CBS 617.96]EXJ90975.1 hypothetical protein A1O1_04082 [Capronia coronata CBS 617.96]